MLRTATDEATVEFDVNVTLARYNRTFDIQQ
jgi:hypothetical protein